MLHVLYKVTECIRTCLVTNRSLLMCRLLAKCYPRQEAQWFFLWNVLHKIEIITISTSSTEESVYKQLYIYLKISSCYVKVFLQVLQINVFLRSYESDGTSLQNSEPISLLLLMQGVPLNLHCIEWTIPMPTIG